MLQRRTRNRICIWIIVAGLVNFLTYTIIYAELGGDAKNGERVVDNESSGKEAGYYIRGHFIHGAAGKERRIAKWLWVYSYIHSISIWPTNGAMIICLLILAQPHIIATMRESNVMRGPTFITVVITVAALLCSAMTIWFTLGLIQELAA